MRIPLIPNLSTKDGEANQNARMTNTLSEKNPTGSVFAAVRPGLELQATAVGNGRGIVEFNNKLLSVYGATLENAILPDRIGYGQENISYLTNGTLVTDAVPLAINYDGTVMGGYRSGGTLGFIWTSTDRLFQIGDLGGGQSVVTHISDDGTKACGYSKNGSNVNKPFIWTSATGIQEVSGFSSDTIITCATSTIDAFAGTTGTDGFIWRDGVGVTTFTSGTSTTPRAIADNYDVVGNHLSGSTPVIFRRTAAGSVTTLGNGRPYCISRDGNVFFGYSGIRGSAMRPFRWTAAGGVVNLTTVAGAIYSCSSDGGRAAGFQNVLSGTTLNPIVWDATNGVVEIDLPTVYEFDKLILNGSYQAFGIRVSTNGKMVTFAMEKAGSPTNYSVGIYQIDYGLDDTAIARINEFGNSYQFAESYPSGDGWTAILSVTTDTNNSTLQQWTRETGTFRSIATLEDQFFDFVQSTL